MNNIAVNIYEQPTYKLKVTDLIVPNPSKGFITNPNHIARNIIEEIEEKISKLPGAMFDDCFPLKHSFADGIYTREIFIPKNNLVVGKIHKYSHPNFLMEGEVAVYTESGCNIMRAPMSTVSAAGTKRLLYTITDVRWVTVHQTSETDIDKIMDDIFVKYYEDLTNYYKDFIRIIKTEGYVCQE